MIKHKHVPVVFLSTNDLFELITESKVKFILEFEIIIKNWFSNTFPMNSTRIQLKTFYNYSKYRQQ